MLQQKYIWVPFLFGFLIISFIQKEVIFKWLNDSQEKVPSFETTTENSQERSKSYQTLKESFQERLSSSNYTENPLDNCNFVYLDMGTNFGVQIRWQMKTIMILIIAGPNLFLMCRTTASVVTYYYKSYSTHLFRKLYEPHLYPGAPVLPIFDKYFGDFQIRNYSQVRNIFHLNSLLKILMKSADLCCWLGAEFQACWLSSADERELQILWTSGDSQHQGWGWGSQLHSRGQRSPGEF